MTSARARQPCSASDAARAHPHHDHHPPSIRNRYEAHRVRLLRQLGSKTFADTSNAPDRKPEVGVNGYEAPTPGETTLLKKGSTREGWDGERTRALDSDILLEHDVELKMRDGARLYCDIYRPADSDEKVPALIMWSPYGKRYSSINMLPVTTWRCGLKSGDLSGWEKFEGLDPATWCPRGYAIVSVDSRGSGNSDGENQIMGAKMGEDGYDAIELLAKMSWCNGNVGMGGNSVRSLSSSSFP